MEELPKLYSLPEVAAALNLSPHTIRAFVRQRKLSPLRICRRLLFDSEELAKFIREARVPLQSIAPGVNDPVVLAPEHGPEPARAINCT